MNDELQTIEYTNDAKEVFHAVKHRGEDHWTLTGPNMKVSFHAELQDAIFKVKHIADGHAQMIGASQIFTQ